MSRSISDIGWEMDGTVLITFLDTDDIRCEGAVALRQTLRIEPSAEFAASIQRLADVAQELVDEAQESWLASAASERALGDDPNDTTAELTEIRDRRERELLDSEAARRNWAAIQASRGQT